MKLKPFHRFIGIALAVIVCAFFAFWFIWFHNPMSEYGVFYLETPGGSETLNHFQFYRDHEGDRRKGPEVTGSLLFVVYRDIDKDGVPEIFVKSQVGDSYLTIMKLNLSEQNKPDFKVLENSLTINYPEAGMYWP